jgi:ABC-type amino acid transport substrate-binding protein
MSFHRGRRRPARPSLLRLALLLLITALPRVSGGEESALFYFYSPDWRPGNLGLLTESAEKMALEVDAPVRFQAFARYEDFVRELRVVTPAFVIAPSWANELAGAAAGLQPLAVATRNNASRYRKALLARPAIETVADLAEGSIAATIHAMGPDGEQTVLDAFNLDPARASVVPVQKDIDALLALTFDQVDAALVTSAQFDAHARVNPAIVRDFHVIGFSPEIDLPLLFASPSVPGPIAGRMAGAFVDAEGSEAGRRLLDLLGFDRFLPAPEGRESSAAVGGGTALPRPGESRGVGVSQPPTAP